MENRDTPILPFDWLLTDELKLMRGQFARHKGGRIEISADGLDAMLRRFDKVITRSKDYENEISRLRWNALAREERQQSSQALIEALGDPHSNVRLFMPRVPVVEVPFSDGRD